MSKELSLRKLYFTVIFDKPTNVFSQIQIFKNLFNFQKLLIIAITLIVGVVCQNGFIKGPDGYKYIIPEDKMELPEPKAEVPEPKAVDNEYLPPVEVENSVNDITVGDFAPYISARSNSDVEAVADVTTVEPEES